jgi:hypothetical protein
MVPSMVMSPERKSRGLDDLRHRLSLGCFDWSRVDLGLAA